MSIEFVVLLVIFSNLFGVVLLVFALHYGQKNRLHRLQQNISRLLNDYQVTLDDLPQQVIGLLGQKVIKLTTNHLTINITDFTGSKNSPACTMFMLSQDVKISFAISKEKVGHKLAKKLRLLKEINLGIPELDDFFFIRVGEDINAKSVLLQARMQETLQRIMKMDNFYELNADPPIRSSTESSIGTITFKLYGSLDRHEKEQIKQVVEIMQLLAKCSI